MDHITEGHLFLFLVQVIILLGAARGLGEIFRRFHQPAITAEILVGIFLGPTLLGRYMPMMHEWLFPVDIVQHNMLETVAWIGILFFLLNNGLEMDFSSAWKQKGDATIIAFSDIILPIIIAFIPCLFLPDSYLQDPSQRILFALFVATIMTISAMPVTARILEELALFKTDMGFMIMCALSINDLIGWLVFTMVLGVFAQDGVEWGFIGQMVFWTLVFTAGALTIGRRIVDAGIKRIYKYELPEPGSSITFVCLVGMLFGALTIRIGIHALFGFFIAGIVAGESKALPEKTRHVISQMVHAIFIPLFFASIGLKIDFAANFDVFFALFIFVIGTVGRFIGAWVGVNLSKQSKLDRALIAIAHTPGGEMQIVVSMLALEYGLLTERVFVGIIFGAVLSSITLGPWMNWALARRQYVRISRFFIRDAFTPSLSATTREEAIRALCTTACAYVDSTSCAAITDAVITRDDAMTTALGHGVAMPHGRVPDFDTPVVILAKSVRGIEWNTPDGEDVHFIFLVLTSPEDTAQLQILRTIAQMMTDSDTREALDVAETQEELATAFDEALTRIVRKHRPRLQAK